MRRLLTSTFLTAISASGIFTSTAANAAQVEQGAPEAPSASQGVPGADQPVPSDIIVTGSRVVRDGSQAPTPVTVVSTETLAQTAPTNIPDALNKLPVFSGSQSQNSTNTFSAT